MSLRPATSDPAPLQVGTSPAPTASPALAPAASERRRWLREAASVAATISLLELIVFHEYFRGLSVPPWDFVGYSTEAFAWWRDGSFFQPVQWLPYLWGGFPAAIGPQNSSWYLPVGAVDAITDFDLQASAVLSALHVGFGAVGMYTLGRQWRLGRPAAWIGLTLWFFAAGFYANASHLDIMRGYAWIPWALLCVSPAWPWQRWWGPPIAGLLLWQTMLAMYPGALVASVYVLGLWVAAVQLVLRPKMRDYLLPLAAAGILAASMTLVRFLPFVLTRGLDSPSNGDESEFSLGLLGTFFYAYDSPVLPNDITMRSFFLPGVAFVLLGLVSWRSPIARIAGASSLTAIALGLPVFPWSGAVGLLPGMDLSRFRMSDFKVSLLASVCVLAMVGAARVVEGVDTGSGRIPTVRELSKRHAVYAGALVVGTALVGALGPFASGRWTAQWSLLVAAILLVAVGCCLPRRQASLAIFGTALVAVLSGLLAVTTTSLPWRADRVAVEAEFDGRVDDLITVRSVAVTQRQRPPRADPGPAVTERTMLDTRWGGAFYSGELSVVGYVNLKGSAAFETIRQQLLHPATASSARAFWSAPGLGIALGGRPLPGPAETVRCAQERMCGAGVTVTPVAYDPATPFVYEVDTARGGTTVSFNEAYYPGWHAEVCVLVGPCIDTAVGVGAAGEVQLKVPAGRSTVTLQYSLPGQVWAWTAFFSGSAGLLLWPAAGAIRRRRERDSPLDSGSLPERPLQPRTGASRRRSPRAG